MAQIKRFKLKDGITIPESAVPGGAGVHLAATHCIHKVIHVNGKDPFGIGIDIAFSEDVPWNDFDFVLVLDEEALQPYFPFYEALQGNAPTFEYLQKFIEAYNGYMSSLPFLEEITEEEALARCTVSEDSDQDNEM